MKNYILSFVIISSMAFSAFAQQEETTLVPMSCQQIVASPLTLQAHLTPRQTNDVDAIRRMEIRVALAEVLHRMGADLDPAHRKVVEQIVRGEIDPLKDPAAEPYKNFMEEMVNESTMLGRMNSEKIANEMNDGQVNLAMMITNKKSIFLQKQTEQSLLQKIIALFSRKPPLNFNLTSTFNTELRAVPANKRLKTLKRSLPNLTSLTLGEVFHIATAFEGNAQLEAIEVLSPKLATPVSIFPMEAVLTMSNVLEPRVRKAFLRMQKYSISKADFLRLTQEDPELLKQAKEAGISIAKFAISKQEFIQLVNENPSLLQQIKDAGASINSFKLSKEEYVDYSINNPALLIKAKEYGIKMEALGAKDLEKVLTAFAAMQKPITTEQADILIRIVKAINGKSEQIAALHLIFERMRVMATEVKAQLDKVLDNIERMPEVSVDEIIETASAMNSSSQADSKLYDYANKYAQVLSVADILAIGEATSSSSYENTILDNYGKVNILKLSIEEIISLAESINSPSVADALLYEYANTRINSLSPAGLRALGDATSSSSYEDAILSLVRH